jgi:CRP-like cAMP-binding protein
MVVNIFSFTADSVYRDTTRYNINRDYMDAPKQNLAGFFATGRREKFSKNEVILAGDENSADIFYIERGEVKVYSISDNGEEYVHVIYKETDIFPLIWALKNRRRRVFYEALSPVVVFRMPKDNFLTYIEQNTNTVSYELINQLAEQFNIYADRLDNLQYKSAHEKVVYRLMFLAYRFGKKDGDNIVIDAPITHKLIADSVNLARESVSREFEKLEAKSLVKIKKGKIVITDVNKLSEEFSEPVSLDYWGLQTLV